MKKKIAAIVASGLTFVSPAFAADLPNRAAPPVFVPPVVVTQWTGCYVGAFGGADIAHVRDDRTETTQTTVTRVTPTTTIPGPPGAAAPIPIVIPGTTTTTTTSRQTASSYGRTSTDPDGGGRIGCNYQTGPIVYGAQLEGGYLGVSNNAVDPLRRTTLSNVSGGPYGALTAKLGYAIAGPVLVYVRGGVGYADLRYRTTDFALNYATAARGGQVMPLVGAGLEYKLTQNVSVTGEYTYLRPGCRSGGYTYATPTATAITTAAATDTSVTGVGRTSSCVDKHMITIGLNYYFNAIAAPVVARY